MHNNIPSQSRFISTGRMPAVVRKGIEAKQPIKKLYVPKKKFAYYITLLVCTLHTIPRIIPGDKKIGL